MALVVGGSEYSRVRTIAVSAVHSQCYQDLRRQAETRYPGKRFGPNATKTSRSPISIEKAQVAALGRIISLKSAHDTLPENRLLFRRRRLFLVRGRVWDDLDVNPNHKRCDRREHRKPWRCQGYDAPGYGCRR